MFVPAATSVNGNHNITTNNLQNTTSIHHSDGPDSLNATYISVVSISFYTFIIQMLMTLYSTYVSIYVCMCASKC